MTEKGIEVIKLMQNGWSLWCMERSLNSSTPLATGYRLQKNGKGKGGEVKKIRSSTIYSLVKLGLITPFILNQSSLTNEGEKLKLEP